MNHNNIRLPLEVALGRELNQLIQGDVVEEIIDSAQIEKIESNWKYILEGHSFKLEAELAPDLFSLCKEVQEALCFAEPIDFYVTNSTQLNAFALARSHKETSHIINLNSALIENFDNDELRFVIGHEIGHLISGNARIAMLLQFVYPNQNDMPLMLQHQINLWNKASELTADRFGYLVCNNTSKVLSSFFKLSSGLSSKRISFNAELYSQQNEKTLNYFKDKTASGFSSHPINPIRVKAIELFSVSGTYKSKGQLSEPDNVLDQSMNELIDIIKQVGNSELDYHRKIFIATAGIIMSQLDARMNQDEYEAIISSLSQFTIFPKEYLNKIAQDNVPQLCNRAIAEIMDINPSERFSLLDFVISIALSDHHIFNGELDFVYHLGENLQFSKKEIAQSIASAVQKKYIPNVFSKSREAQAGKK